MTFKKYKIPKMKKIKDLVPGEIIRLEHGCENNFVTAIFKELEIVPKQHTEWYHIHGTYTNQNRPFETWIMASKNKNLIEIIGESI